MSCSSSKIAEMGTGIGLRTATGGRREEIGGAGGEKARSVKASSSKASVGRALENEKVIREMIGRSGGEGTWDKKRVRTHELEKS